MRESNFVEFNAKRAADRKARIMDIIRERSKVNENGCWIWQRFVNAGGYGLLCWEGKQDRAHRVAYKVSIGPVPPGMDVCHTCDNPTCCNPEHLWLGTRAQNAIDSVLKGRNPRKQQTHCIRGHAYAEHGFKKGNHRGCKLCHRRAYRIRSGWPADLAESVPRVPHGYIVVPGATRRIGRMARTHCTNGHEMTTENIYVAPGTGLKRCRKCRANAVQAHFRRVAEKSCESNSSGSRKHG